MQYLLYQYLHLRIRARSLLGSCPQAINGDVTSKASMYSLILKPEYFIEVRVAHVHLVR